MEKFPESFWFWVYDILHWSAGGADKSPFSANIKNPSSYEEGFFSNIYFISRNRGCNLYPIYLFSNFCAGIESIAHFLGFLTVNLN